MSRNGRTVVLSVVLLAALALASCSGSFRYPGQRFFESDPKPSTPSAVPATRAPAAATPAVEAAPNETESGAVAEVEGWRKTGITEEEGLSDSDACYRYANAQVSKDIRIDGDIDAARGVSNSLFERSPSLDRRVDAYYYNNQRVARFESCMRSRGYSQD